MSLALSPVVGTIQFDPLASGAANARRGTDDSTLGLLFDELAHCERLDDGDQPIRLIAAGRLSRCGLAGEMGQAVVWADLARLVDDLEAEYDEIDRGSPQPAAPSL
jgi:hypothetical protein